MKKLIAVMITLMLICICSVTAFADEVKYDTAGDLFQYWEQNDAYPDYVSGVWSTDGGITNLTIAVQNTDEGNAGKQEILDLIENDSTVTFEYRDHSYNKLKGVQEELYPYFKKDLGLVSSGVYQEKGKVVIGILKENKDNPATIEMIEEIKSIYGNIIEVEYTDQLVETLLNIGKTPISYTEPIYYLPFIAAAVILLAFFSVLILRKKRTMVLQTNAGDTTVSSTTLSTKEIEDVVKNSKIDIPTDLDEKVFNAIEN